jgi:hypothetical protein
LCGFFVFVFKLELSNAYEKFLPENVEQTLVKFQTIIFIALYHFKMHFILDGSLVTRMFCWCKDAELLQGYQKIIQTNFFFFLLTHGRKLAKLCFSELAILHASQYVSLICSLRTIAVTHVCNDKDSDIWKMT